jgi:N-acetylglucosamine malate deacetylase 1
MRILVLAPHPNDEIIGAGGTIAIARDAGHDVSIGHLTNGEQGSGSLPADRLRPARQAEAIQAAAIVGVPETRLRFLDIPDGGIDPYDTAQFTAVLALLRSARPDRLYLPHPHDGAFDHEAAFALCWRAAGMSGSRNFAACGAPHWVPTVLGYEVWQPIAAPAYLQDITPVIDRKITALECYRTQTPAAKGAGQSSQVGPGGTVLSAWRGVTTTGGHREAFDVLRLGALP